MRLLGIDLGSRSVKLVIFESGKFLESKIFDTSVFYRKYCKSNNGRINIDFQALDLSDFEKIISTGYGRNNVNIENSEVILELKAHAFGAMWQTQLKNFTLLDIGGQDSKVMAVRNGKISDMILNDKCAASCGRYLENMANVLDISLNEMVEYFEEPVELSSTCAVFGESELIGRISEGFSMEQLAAGVNYSLFKRVKPLIERFPGDTFVVTGGVAGNKALINFIKQELSFKETIIPLHSQLNGAIGCCAYAITKLRL